MKIAQMLHSYILYSCRIYRLKDLNATYVLSNFDETASDFRSRTCKNEGRNLLPEKQRAYPAYPWRQRNFFRLSSHYEGKIPLTSDQVSLRDGVGRTVKGA